MGHGIERFFIFWSWTYCVALFDTIRHPQLSLCGNRWHYHLNALQGLLTEKRQHYLEGMSQIKPLCHQTFVALLGSSSQHQIIGLATEPPSFPVATFQQIVNVK